MSVTRLADLVTFADLATRVLTAPRRLGSVRLVAVDGPSGSGKTAFAGRLAAALRGDGLRGERATVELVHTDDLLDGWHDTVSFWPRLAAMVLTPLRQGRPGGYRPYDWTSRVFGERTVDIPVPDVLVLDGVTSARRAIRPELALGVFVTAPPELRLERALARDGDAIRLELAGWRRREDAFFAEDGTQSAVDLVVDGAPAIAHDPARECVRWTRKQT